MSRWMTPFWWACCTARQTCTNSPSRSRGRAGGAGRRTSVIGHALDQLHDEVRPAGRRSPRRRTPWRCSGGPSGPGPAAPPRTGPAPRRRVHPRLDDLQRDPAADRLLLLGHEDDAHPALADLLQQLVRPDRPCPGRSPAGVVDAVRSGRGGRRRPGSCRRACGRRAGPRPRAAGRRRRRRPGRGTAARSGGRAISTASRKMSFAGRVWAVHGRPPAGVRQTVRDSGGGTAHGQEQ